MPLERVIGRGFERVFLDKLRYQRFCNPEMVGGIGPERLLRLTERLFSDFRLPIWSGILPVRWFWLKDMFKRLPKLHKDLGIWPENWLLER